jgi:methyltransferase (TIGR00027 family)
MSSGESIAGGFGPDQPSRTSIVVAALRAFGAREPDASVRNPDSLAAELLTDDDLRLITDHPISRALKADYEQSRLDREVAGMSNLMLVRTRFVDDHLEAALKHGASQIVVLGAGFDTRGYRFAELLKGKKFFEVDYRSTQQLKQRRLRSALGSIPPHVRFAEIDFNTQALMDVLCEAGYTDQEKAFFIWEGVTMYLPEEAVRQTLRTLATHSQSGSRMVMDFAGRAMIEVLNQFPHLPQHRYTTAWGEPWIFGLPDNHEKEFFSDCGLEFSEVFSVFGAEAVKRYLTRADGTRLGSIRGGSPEQHALSTMARMMWRFITTRSYWYALAELAIP